MFICNLSAATFELVDQGTEKIVQYEKYGVFENIGTNDCKYTIKDHKGLKTAIGAGIYPNRTDIYRDPIYKQFKNEGKLEGSHWEFVNTDDHQANFYKWATASEAPGVKLFYTALALEKAGLFAYAVKAYYAILVHFPKAVGYTYWNTPWYVGPVAIEKIEYLTRINPSLGMKLEGAVIQVKNRFDNELENDVYIINPGKIVEAKKGDFDDFLHAQDSLKKLEIIESTGGDWVKLVKYTNGHWQLLVHDKPYYIRGMCYSPNPTVLAPFYPTPEGRTLDVSKDWQYEDVNKNGIVDGPYEAWLIRIE